MTDFANYGSPAPPSMAPTTGPGSDATAVFGRRSLAWLIDLVLFFALIGGVFAALAEYVEIPPGVDETFVCDTLRLQDEDAASGCVAVGDRAYLTSTNDNAIQTAASFGYFIFFVVFQGVTGASPGKLVTGLRVVKADGTKAGIGKSLVRTLLWVVDAAPWFVPAVGFITGLTSTGHRRVGDMAANTYVVGRRSVGTPVAAAIVPGPAGAQAWGAPPSQAGWYTPAPQWPQQAAPPVGPPGAPAPPAAQWTPPTAPAPATDWQQAAPPAAQPPAAQWTPPDAQWTPPATPTPGSDWQPAAPSQPPAAPPAAFQAPVEPAPPVDPASDEDYLDQLGAPEDWSTGPDGETTVDDMGEHDDWSTGPVDETTVDGSGGYGDRTVIEPSGDPTAIQPTFEPTPDPASSGQAPGSAFAAPGADAADPAPAPSAQPAAAAAPTPAPAELPPPQWDQARNTYIQWDPNQQAWLQWDSVGNHWKPIDT